jgi:hypothetical protein
MRRCCKNCIWNDSLKCEYGGLKLCDSYQQDPRIKKRRLFRRGDTDMSPEDEPIIHDLINNERDNPPPMAFTSVPHSYDYEGEKKAIEQILGHPLEGEQSEWASQIRKRWDELIEEISEKGLAKEAIEDLEYNERNWRWSHRRVRLSVEQRYCLFLQAWENDIHAAEREGLTVKDYLERHDSIG